MNIDPEQKNMIINWNHILDKQPEHDRQIIQCDEFYYPEYRTIGIRKYYQTCTWQAMLDEYKKSDLKPPNFWWIYTEDFPWPEIDHNYDG